MGLKGSMKGLLRRVGDIALGEEGRIREDGLGSSNGLSKERRAGLVERKM